MDQEPVLNLSDVVHDEPMDDEDNNTAADSGEDQPTSIHETYTDSTPTHHLTNLEFSVEMLEREIATLLNQNASAASAALLNAAAQQRQAHLEQESSPDGDGANNHEGVAALGLNLNGLAAVLQAAHAQAAENERVAQALAAKDPVFARQREAALAEKEQKTTRTAPAFHSLTASEVPERPQKGKVGEGKKGSDGSDYLYTDESESDREEGEGAADVEGHRRTTVPIPRTQIVASPGSSPPVPGEFTDLSDILHHLSSHFDPESDHVHGHTDPSTPDSSPIFSRSQAESHQTHLPILTPSTDGQPSASTSAASGANSGGAKQGKKNKDKDKGPHAHICDEEHCRKSFTRRSDLARHMRIHTGERPFVCAHNGCGKTFIQRSALHVHLRVHTGEKPHSCEYPACGKTFGDSSSLARHRRTHTGKRPYKCEDPECEKTFTRRTTLTQHMRTHDPTWEPDPNIKYNFKSKKRKVAEDDERELEESVRTISALFQAGANSMAPTSVEYVPSDEPLEVQVASISAEIAAAIAQAHQGRVYEDEEEEEDEESGSGQEMAGPEMIGPNTSGIRGGDNGRDGDSRAVGGGQEEEEEEEEDDSDTFPVPLRTRKGKESVAIIGTKRKR